MKRNATIQTGVMRLQGSIKPSTWNAENRTLDVEFASEYPVLRYSWSNDEYYMEILSMTEEAADFARFVSGAVPVQKDHRYSVDSTIGRAISARIENGKAVATIQLSEREELAGFVKDILAGIIRNISVGYNVNSYDRVQRDKKSYPEYIARGKKAWETLEISFVGVPADPTVGARSEQIAKDEAQQIRSSNNLLYNTSLTTMDEDEKPVAQVETERGADPTPNKPVQERAATTAPDVSAAVATAVAEATAAERARVKIITVESRTAGLPEEFAQGHIENNTSVNDFRAELVKEWGKKDPAENLRSTHKVTKDEADQDMKLRVMGMCLRGNAIDFSGVDPQLIKEARQYQAHSLVGLARISLERNGLRNVSQYSDYDIAQMILGDHERAIVQSTNDFANLLGGVVHQILEAPLGLAADTWRETAHIMSVNDFREHKFLTTWGLTNIDELDQTGEIKDKPLVDATGERISIRTFANIINMSRQMIVNDDLGAFQRSTSNLIRAWHRTIEKRYYDKLAENSGAGPTMDDGNALFSVAHGNLLTAANMDSTKLDDMRQAMGILKDPGSLDYLDVRPKILLTSLKWEKIAGQYNESRFDLDSSNKSSFKPSISAGLYQKVVGSPRVPGVNYYYSFADPDQFPVMAVAFLRGKQTPTVSRHEPWRQDGIEFKLIGDFGVGAVGFRGANLNKGT